MIDKIYLLGELFAKYERLGVISPTYITVVAVCPQKFVGQYTAKAMKKPGYADIEGEVSRIITQFKPEEFNDTPIGIERQGAFFLGYHKEKAIRRNGRPRSISVARDWSSVDWSKSNAAIAYELGVSPQVVGRHRRRYTSPEEAPRHEE